MPGLLLAIGGDGHKAKVPFARAVNALRHGERYTEAVSHGSGFSVAAVTHSRFGLSQHRDEGAEVSVWLYGAVSPEGGPAGERSPAAELCARYLHRGKPGLEAANGEFNFVVHDERRRRLLVGNDRFGIRPWYRLEAGDVVVLAPEVKALLAFRGSAPALDPISVAGFFAFNKIRLGDRTMFTGIEVLPPASLWEVDLSTGSIQRSQYWTFRYNDSMEAGPASDETVVDLVEIYRRAMAERTRIFPGARVGISLSGGLDSRTMVAALPPELCRSVSAHTYGLLDSDEVTLAQRVAEEVGMEHSLYALGPDDYIAHARDGARLSDELDIFVQAAQVRWLGAAEPHLDVVMTGIDLDVTLGGIYLVPDVQRAVDDADIVGLLERKNSVFRREEMERLLSRDFWKHWGEATYDFAAELVSALPQESAPAKYDLFINQYSMRRIIMMRYALNRFHMETASPMYDYEFMDRILDVPSGQRAAHALFQPFLVRLSRSLAEITYQRTMLPANAPREFWDVSSELERQREKLYLDIWRATRGEVAIPYRRYYTNFDEWLRTEPTWLAETDELLVADAPLVYEYGLVDRKYVERLVEEHRSGERSRRQQLICLMSLELYLREHQPAAIA